MRTPLRSFVLGLWLCLAAGPSFAQAPEAASEEKSQPEIDPAKEEARMLSGTRQLTFAGKRSGEGYFSADGTKMIFQSEREDGNPFFQIYLMDLETGDIERISPGEGKTTCAWIHPDSKRVLFASTQDDVDAVKKQEEELDLRAEGKQRRYSWDYDQTFEIYEYNLETREFTNLTNTTGYDAEGSYSPDGKHILFASNRQGYDGTAELSKEDSAWFKMNPSFLMDLYLAKSDGSDVERLTTAPGYDGGPFFSADGKEICWRRFDRKGERAEIFTMDLETREERQLTHIGAMSWAPYFHPSGEYLVFNTNTNGFANFELYLVDAAGTKQPVRVTWTDGFDGLASFSPDGKQLTWTSTRNSTKKSQIYLASWNHEAAMEALAKAPAKEVAPDSDLMTKSEFPGIRDAKPEFTEEDLKAHIEYLASEELEGRMTGTEGEALATAYAAEAYKSWGLKPWKDDSYFQNFEFTAGVDLGPKSKLELKLGEESLELEAGKDWLPLSYSELGPIDAKDIVFVGFGIDIPEGQMDADGGASIPYSSYYHTDVKDKWVMMLRFVPEGLEGERRRTFMRFGSLRYKAVNARQKGAKGVIFVSGPNSKVKEELVPLTFDASLAGSGIAAISVTTEVGEKLITQAGENFGEIQDMLDKGEMMMGLAIPDTTIDAEIDIKQEKASGRNVIGILEAKDPEARKQPAIIIGAHIDHLGNKPNPSSLALGKDRYEIHHGADDNASGTASMLEIAHYLADQQQQGKIELTRNVWFAAWSGEELGLLGASHFVREMAEERHDDPDAMLGDVFAANLNMDMVGRLTKTVVLQGIGSSSVWLSEIERRNAPVGLPITIQSDTYLSTDATAFYLREVPILSAFTGAHEDYHRPTDTVDKINFEGAQKISRFMGLIARGLATNEEAPDYIAVERPEEQGRRANLRAYLGTIPDYAQGDIEGVKLSGVSAGGPADEAGVKSGDVVIGLAGKEVKNIYDYTYLLEALKVGEETDIIVERKGEKVTLKITPGSRE